MSQNRIVGFEIHLHSKSPLFYRLALHGKWNVLNLTSRALKDKIPTPTIPHTTVLQNHQVFLPDLVYVELDVWCNKWSTIWPFPKKWLRPKKPSFSLELLHMPHIIFVFIYKLP
jgi:hypothetical protein